VAQDPLQDPGIARPQGDLKRRDQTAGPVSAQTLPRSCRLGRIGPCPSCARSSRPVSALAILAAAPPLGAQTFPDPSSTTVNDFADLLPESEERALAQRLTRLERETGVELTVVTLPSQADYAPDMTLEAFATALFDHWGVGKAETNDGVMVLVFRDDRAMRLELGAAYGRDWDRVAQDVVERHFLNAFATGDYVRGLTWGTEQTIERIVMPFREGAAPPGGGGVRDWIIGIGMFGAVLLAMSRAPDRRPAGAPPPCPQCGRRGLRQTRSVLTARHRHHARHGRTAPNLPLLRFRDARQLPYPGARNSSRGGSFGGGRSGGGGASGRW
jgi:uncharacterized protein